MRELTTHDTGRAVLFLDAFTFVPGIGPSSDMDGHDLSGLTYSETMRCEEWCDAFNEHYLDKAFESNYMGMPIILVKDFYSEDVFGDDEEDTDAESAKTASDEEKLQMFNAIVGSWMMFDLTQAEEQKLKAELKKKLEIVE